jgi:hypothetical protein
VDAVMKREQEQYGGCGRSSELFKSDKRNIERDRHFYRPIWTVFTYLMIYRVENFYSIFSPKTNLLHPEVPI